MEYRKNQLIEPITAPLGSTALASLIVGTFLGASFVGGPLPGDQKIKSMHFRGKGEH
jgi:hypothetical protein